MKASGTTSVRRMPVPSMRRMPVPLGVWCLMGAFTTTALGAGLQEGTSDPGGATAIEQALVEHACSATRTSGATETDAYRDCLRAQLLSLRADLGRDLSRLSSSERRTLDSVCSDVRAASGREAYVECLSARLASLRNRRKNATPPPSQGSALAPPAVSAPGSPAPPARQASWWASRFWIGATIVTLFVTVGGVLLAVKLLAVKARPLPRVCRVCGNDVPESGDLCQPCRHEAAEAVRNAAAERAGQQRAEPGAPNAATALGWRPGGALEEEHRGQKALQEEEGEARLRQEEEERQREKDAGEREEALQRQEEEARQRSQTVSEEVFDSCAVLGVPQGASREDIEVAYQKAKSKYDPDQVAHLSAEVQEHYRVKAEAVERARQELTDDKGSSTEG
jgi:hypothetical protein